MHFPSLKIDGDKIAREAGSPRFCEHAQQALRKKIDKTGKPRFHNQCLVCGASVGTRIGAKALSVEQIEKTLLFDTELQASYWRAYAERSEAKRQQEINRLKGLWQETYDKYLASPLDREEQACALASARCLRGL